MRNHHILLKEKLTIHYFCIHNPLYTKAIPLEEHNLSSKHRTVHSKIFGADEGT